MFDDLKKYMLERDLLTVMLGFLAALALFTLLETVVGAVIGPVIAAIFGEYGLVTMSFTVNNAEFQYGTLISAVLVVLLTLVVVYLLASVARRAHRRD